MTRLSAPLVLALLFSAGGPVGATGSNRFAAEAPSPPDASPAGPPPLHVECHGERNAAPTVILEAGAFGTSADWPLVLTDLAAGGRACAYDRSGLGLSPPRPDGVAPLDRAAELGALLDQLGETRPVILVGHSNGALYVEAFADLHPDRVAGLVFVNGVGSDALSDPALLADLREERRDSNLALSLGRMGLWRVVAGALAKPMGFKGKADALKRSALAKLYALKTARDEDRAIIPGLTQVRDLGPTPSRIPIVAVIGAPYPRQRLARAWRAAEIAPTARADHAWVLDAPGASHTSPLVRDRAYITAAVGWLRSSFAVPIYGP